MGMMNLGSPSVIAEKRELLITHVTAMYGHLQTSRRKSQRLPFPGQEQAPPNLRTLSRVFPVGV